MRRDTLGSMAAERGSPYVWIDIDNPPQVLYLFPFVDAFRSRNRPVSSHCP